MRPFLICAALLAALCVATVAEAHPRRVMIVRRQRIVQPAAQAVTIQRPLQLVPRQTLILGY